jgi:hydroxymethylbilane synthase
LAELKSGARVGTSSVRREAQVKRARPDLRVVLLRGNVGTRLGKLQAGDADGIILARAGLERLGCAPRYEILDGPNWLPAPCQGTIAIEVCTADARARELVGRLNCPETSLAIACERGFLAALDGSCRTPIAGLTRMKGTHLSFAGEVLSLDGSKFWRASRDAAIGSRADAAGVGGAAADEIRARAGSELPVS